MILVMRMDETIPGTAIKVEPKFVNAANGDFTLSSSEHIANRCGDPRWLPTTE